MFPLLPPPHRQAPTVDPSTLGNFVASIGPPDGLGELSLISKNPRSLSAAASPSGCLACRISADTYNASVIKSMQSEKFDLETKLKLLKRVPLFSGLANAPLTHLSYCLTLAEYSLNDKVATFGEAVRQVFIIVEGELSLKTKIKLSETNILGSVTYEEVKLASITNGAILGDIETTVDKSPTYKVTARVATSKCTVLKMLVDDFDVLVLNAPDTSIGRIIREGAAATHDFRKQRLLEAQKARMLEKKKKVDMINSNSKIVQRLRSKARRATFAVASRAAHSRPETSPAFGGGGAAGGRGWSGYGEFDADYNWGADDDARRRGRIQKGKGKVKRRSAQPGDGRSSQAGGRSHDDGGGDLPPMLGNSGSGKGRRPSFNSMFNIEKGSAAAGDVARGAGDLGGSVYSLPGLNVKLGKGAGSARGEAGVGGWKERRKFESMSMSSLPVSLESSQVGGGGAGFGHYSQALNSTFGDFMMGGGAGKEPTKGRTKFTAARVKF